MSPRQGRPKSTNRLERALFRKFWSFPNFGDPAAKVCGLKIFLQDRSGQQLLPTEAIRILNIGKIGTRQLNSRIRRNLYLKDSLLLKTCMRAVNRQPLFTARGARRAFSFSNSECSAMPGRCKNQTVHCARRKDAERISNSRTLKIFNIFNVFFGSGSHSVFRDMENAPRHTQIS